MEPFLCPLFSQSYHELWKSNQIQTYISYQVLQHIPSKSLYDVRKSDLSENSIGVSDGCNICGSIYQTSHTTAHDVINCTKCIVKDCLH